MTTPPSHRPPDHAGDAELRRLLRDLPPAPADTDPAAVEALQRRVMGRWAAVHRVSEPVIATAAAGRSGALGPDPLRSAPSARGWRIALAGALVLAAVAATLAGLQRPDPSIDELMRLDVLSQIAAGEL